MSRFPILLTHPFSKQRNSLGRISLLGAPPSSQAIFIRLILGSCVVVELDAARKECRRSVRHKLQALIVPFSPFSGLTLSRSPKQNSRPAPRPRVPHMLSMAFWHKVWFASNRSFPAQSEVRDTSLEPWAELCFGEVPCNTPPRTPLRARVDLEFHAALAMAQRDASERRWQALSEAVRSPSERRLTRRQAT